LLLIRDYRSITVLFMGLVRVLKILSGRELQATDLERASKGEVVEHPDVITRYRTTEDGSFFGKRV
jgi:predicted SnoaL-like aldol condensation-catalyzing enzyme